MIDQMISDLYLRNLISLLYDHKVLHNYPDIFAFVKKHYECMIPVEIKLTPSEK